MAHDYSEVQNAFLDGVLEVFTELFTDQVEWYLLDTERTVVDTLYEETADKVYKDPVKIVAKVSLTRNQGERTPEAVDTDATVKIPTKVLIELGVPFETREDLKVLEQSKFKYRGMTLQALVATPSTHVGDTNIFLNVSCTEIKKEG